MDELLNWSKNNLGIALTLVVIVVSWVSSVLWKTRKSWLQWQWVQSLKHRFTRKSLPTAQKEFTVAITHLAGDDREAVRKQLLDALSDLPLEVAGFDRHQKFSLEVAQKEQGQKQHERARQWLAASKVDLLIWGQVLPASEKNERRVRLHFTAKDSDEQQTHTLSENQALEFPINAKEPLEAMIRSQVLTRMASFSDSHPIAEELQKEVNRMEGMATNWPQGETRAALHLALGSAWRAIGDQRGDASALQKAVVAFQEVLKVCTRERDPFNWAVTQNNLGNALGVLGARQSDSANLNAAVVAFNEALKERTRARAPLDWAKTQSNLGNALAILGQREGDSAKLNAAIAAYREALKEYTRERVPLAWATMQNNLGNALQTSGALEGNSAKLNAAVAAYHEALKERTKGHVPLAWALTQNGLGNALLVLGVRDSSAKGLQLLRDAKHAYEQALKVFEAAKASYYINATKQNLAIVQALLDKRGGSK